MNGFGSGAGLTLHEPPSRSPVPFNVMNYGAVADGVADDTAAFLAAIDALPAQGGDVIAPPGSYRITSTVSFPNGSGLRGSGHGGLSSGYSVRPTYIDARDDYFKTHTALECIGVAPGLSASGNTFEGFFLDGPAPETVAASKTLGSCGIDFGYYGANGRALNLYITGFSNQIQLRQAHNTLISGVFGKQSGTHGLVIYSEAGDACEGITVLGCLFSDAGQATGLVPATHRPGNIYIENARDVKLLDAVIDESFNGSATVGIYGLAEDIDVQINRIYCNYNHATNRAVRIGDGTGADKQKRVRITNVHCVPYSTVGTVLAKGIEISSTAEDTVLTNVSTSSFTAGNDIVNNGVRTVFHNVNGQSSVLTKGSAPLAADFAGLPTGVIRGPIFNTADDKLYYLMADGTTVKSTAAIT